MTEMIRFCLGRSYTFIIDEEDIDLDKLKWTVYSPRNERVYLNPTNNSKDRKPLHTTILERKLGREVRDGYQCDHRDRNTLNNSRRNLREATPSQNIVNYEYRTNQAIARGVQMQRGRYYASIESKGAVYHLGTFDTIEEASKAYQAKHVELYGEFSPYYVENPE